MLNSQEIEPIDNVLIVKVGTSTLVNRAEDGTEQFDNASFQRIGRQIMELQDEGEHVILVTSAAITAGMLAVGQEVRPSRKDDMVELQRLSAIGWNKLLNRWSFALPERIIGNLLLTKHELNTAVSERRQALMTTHRMLSHGDIVIANENDAISHEEIEFGDNDTLAAHFAARIRQSNLFGDNVRLILLSDVEGVLENPSDPSSVISKIHNVHDFSHVIGPMTSKYGTGGMDTKFSAATVVLEQGVDMYIANGRREHAIRDVLAGKTGTHFTAEPKRDPAERVSL